VFLEFWFLSVNVLLLAAPNPGYNCIATLGRDTVNRGKDHGYYFHYVSWQPTFISFSITTKTKTEETLKLRHIFLFWNTIPTRYTSHIVYL